MLIQQLSLLLSWIYRQTDWERASFTDAGRVDVDLAIVIFNDLLDNVEAKADTFVVYFCCPLQLSKTCKEQSHVLFCDAVARVNHIDE